MKRLLFIFIALTISLGLGCLKKEPTAIEELLAKSEKDPLEAMKLDPIKGKKKGSSKKNGELFSEPSEKTDLEASLSPINRIPKYPKKKIVTILANETIFRQGPGTKYKNIGVGRKGEQFQLLKIKKDSSGGKWYLAQDQKEKKFFISSLFSTIKEQKNLQKQTMSRGESSETLKKLKTVVDTTPPLPPELKEAKNITLNFEDTDVYDVITTFCELLKLDYIIEGQVSGKVTLQTFNKIAVEDLYSVLEQILALNNFTVVRSGNFYRFLPIKEAVKKPLSIYYGKNAKVPPNERLVIQIIPLRHITSQSMKKIVAPLLTNNASFIEIPETNNLLMIELASNVGRILKVVEALDIDKLAASDIELYTIKNSNASLVASELQEVFNALGYEETVGQSLNFLPLERLNAILVVNPFKSILSTIEFWIEKLDQPIVSESQVSTFVYYVQHSEAKKLAGVLNKIFSATSKKSKKTAKQSKLLKKQPSTASKTPTKTKTTSTTTESTRKISVKGGFGNLLDDDEEELTIVDDEDTNSLIIRTSPRKYPAILELLKKLDLMPQQVLIEVLILDLVMSEDIRKGFNWAIQGKLENAGFGTGSTTNSGVTDLNANLPFATNGFSFALANVSKLKALITASQADSKVNILSNPTLITSDNKAASISVTNEIPIQSTQINTPTAGQPLTQSTIEYRSVGIKLNIEPKINSDNFVNLKINQEISSSSGTLPGDSAPSFNVRSINTEVVLRDNQVLVMGGLMQKSKTEGNSGIPILKDMPVFGRLFRAENELNEKTELMVFVTPHIITDFETADNVTRQVKDRLKGLGKQFNLRKK